MSPQSPVDAAALAQPAGRPDRHPWRVVGVRLIVGLVIAAWSLLLLAWLSLHWFILPHIQQWRAPIESRASAALGVPVRIGTIAVHSSGWVPGIELHDVVLLDPAGRTALRLPRVVAALSARSLVALELRFEQLLIDGAELEIRRDGQGRLFVAGLDLGGSASGSDDSAAADWFFRQGEFVIRQGAIRWVDEQRHAPPLALTDVQLIVRNSLRHHTLRVDATPPAEWGDRFTLQGRFTQRLLGRSGDWKRWSGSAYANLPRADVRELKRHVDLPFDLSEGNGALRAWVELQEGEPRLATVDVALRAVALRLAPDAEPLVFEQMEGRLEGQRDGEGGAIALRRFGFLTGDGIRWPPGDLALNWRQRPGEPMTGGSFTAQRLDVGVIADVAARVPIGDAARRLLGEVKPRGVLNGFNAQWQGPLDAPERYQVKGALSALSLAPRPSSEAQALGRPGLRNATLDLHATESGGEARIALKDGAVELPGVFADPLVPLDQLSAQLTWKIEPAKAAADEPKLSVQVREAKFANADVRGELNATWSSGDPADKGHGGRFPGRLELEGKLADGVATRIARYLPLGLPEATRRYVEGAVRGGTVKTATYRVKGHLRDFPFHNARTGKDGEFRIAVQAENATFAFAPDAPQWPALTGVNGELVIDRSTLEIRNARAALGSIEWGPVSGQIPNLGERPVVALEATAKGPLAEMVKVVNATPIGGWISKSLAGTSATGPAELKLALDVPLSAVSTTTVKGSVALPGNDIRISPDTPLLASAKGRVDFTQKGFAVVGATARVFGGDAAFDGGTQPDASVRFSGQGSATAEALRRAAELGPVARIAGSLNGQAAYRFSLGFAHGRPQMLVTSNLVGLGIDLPPPLAKPAAAPLELRYQTVAVEDAALPANTIRESLRVDLGNVLQAQYLREQSGDAARVVRGGIGVLAPAPTPAKGVAANLVLQRLDVDAWEAAFDKLFGAAVGSPSSGGAETARERAAVTTGAGDGAAGSPGDDYVPDAIALRAQEVQSGARRITGVVAGATEEAGGLWRANINAEQLEGYVEFRPPRRRSAATAAGPGPGRIYARLSRLSLPKSEVAQVESTLLDEQPASAVPGLDIVVDDFELRGRRFGRVEIEAANRIRRDPGREAVREWRLTKMNVTVPEAQLTATGTWVGGVGTAGDSAPKRRASMDFKLAVSDSGALLERLGAGKAIRGGKGALAGQVSWIGSPLSPDYPSMDGQINVAIDAGQFLKVEPGAARLLSVLSLQSLPRRLAFDFRDLFEQGFAFDSVTGDVAIDDGVARTNNLRMRGPAAVVLMEGRADIGRETQDLRVVVVPEINAGTASLAYAIINPAVGIGTFLAQYFLRKPLIEAGTREFHVSGPWDDPKVERVDRRRAQEVSAAEPPAAAASSPKE
jgi:uncharacterized protein (TIGR02099 family)